MADEIAVPLTSSGEPECGIAALGTVGSFAGLFSAAACCVLPLALAAVGIGAGGLSSLVRFQWPLTIISALAIAAGWFLYFRRRRACARDASCSLAGPSRVTFVLLSLATTFVLLSSVWKWWFEQPLMRLFGGV